ncbi:MAG: FAD:protein FMN transferase, partial [Sphingobacteriaceae bacterium]
MRKIGLLLIFVWITTAVSAQILRKRTTKLMGSRWDITIVAKDSISAEKNIDLVIAEVSRIENLISDWKPTSQISQVNSNAGIK